MANRPKDTQDRIIHRLKISKGHLNKVISMMEKDVYCVDILHQIQAIEKALKNTSSLILEYHLKGCVADAISQGRKDEAISEIMQVFNKNER